MRKKIKIALADDEILIRQGIKTILLQENEFEVVFDVSNGKELIVTLEENPQNLPDIILMDINMPEYNGVEATKYLSKKFPEISIIAVSSYTSETFMKKMISVGAVCYIPKNFTPLEMINRIKKVYTNGFCYQPEMVAFIKNNHANKNETPEISEREKEVLQLICQQKSASEIAELLSISSRTVDNHRNSLLQKTNSKNVIGLVVFAIQNHLFLTEK
jgi:DNA-binding NarL/FixJ family response regulator